MTSIGSVNYSYDRDGNLTGDGTWTNSWSYNDRLLQSAKTGTTVSYTYDHTGQRVKYSNGTTTTYYPSKFYNTDGAIPKKHIFALGMEVAVVNGTGGSAAVRYIHTDQLAGANIITNANDTIDETLDYYPYGSIRINSGTYNEQRKYIGQEYDADTSLNYLNARYYDSTKGQFVSEDSMFWKLPQELLIDPQQQNSYSYAQNNPINKSDPSGNITLQGVINSVKKALNSWFGRSSSNNGSIISTEISAPKTTVTPKTTTWDAVSNQRIKQLDSRVQQPATNFINNTESQLNTQLRVTTGFRSIEEQNRLYNQSITTGPWVTSAKGGQSYHNYGRAIDVVIMEEGKPNWNKAVSPEIANLAKDQGFEWGGNWVAPKTDYPHFQMTLGQTWQELFKVSQ